MKKRLSLLTQPALPACLCILAIGILPAQNLPLEMNISADGKRLVTGGNPSGGLYDEAVVQEIELVFSQANYWTLLTNNYTSGADIPATLVVNGDTLASPVGVRFKGQTSYVMTQNSQKKSFNITLDYQDPDQDIDGYETLNLNNGFQDPSFIREVLYLHQSRNHTPSLKGSFAHLRINGENWGLYPSVQALDGDYLKEWFLSNDGTRWRALKTIGGGPGPGGGATGGAFGTGYSSLNYLGTTDTAEYKKFYTLKKANKTNPWDDLVKVCAVLNNTPLSNLEDSIRAYMDLDRTLWELATEIMFSDDDGYVHKGGMDYYLYWEPETKRLVVLEYDGNSVMLPSHVSWSPFYNETDSRFALLNRLLAVPAIRQRYLAHVRTMLDESFDQADINGRIDTYYSLIDPFVVADNKKLFTYIQFVAEKQVLKNFVQQRRNLYLSNAEVDVLGLEISNASFLPAGPPDAGVDVPVTVQVGGAVGVNKVSLYFGTGFVGHFQKTAMYDDGNHGDGAANDGVFGGIVPGFEKGAYVRFYIEAIANNTPKTASYLPKGAEHDVFFYRVNPAEPFQSDVVINEFMASNSATAADQDGEYDDWIELYNKSANTIDISGWTLTDSEGDLRKWAFPEGTFMDGNSYLIVWADEDGGQAGLHANFKLSASGEQLLLLDPDVRMAQQIIFGQQVADMGYARVPNGTGGFVAQNPTFAQNNETATAAFDADKSQPDLVIYPNPASQQVFIQTQSPGSQRLVAYSFLGQKIFETQVQGQAVIDVGGWAPGVYVLQVGEAKKKLRIGN